MKNGHLNKTVRDEGFGSMDLPGLIKGPDNTVVVKYPLNKKNEMMRFNCFKNHDNGRNFHINEQMMKIYEENINLQCKLDKITVNGAGNYSPKLLQTLNSF